MSLSSFNNPSSVVTVFFRRKSEREALARDRAKDGSVLAS